MRGAIGARGASLCMLAALGSEPACAVAADLQLPPGAIVISAGKVSHPYGLGQAAVSSSTDNGETAGAGPTITPLGVTLPPGATLIDSRRASPKFAATLQPYRKSPPLEIAEAIAAPAERHGVSASIPEAVAWQESRYDHTRVSPKGARGVMKLMPDTALGLNVDQRDLRSNIEGGAAYLASLLRRFGNLPLALAAYNPGPGAVERFPGIPPYAETQASVSAILSRLGPNAY